MLINSFNVLFQKHLRWLTKWKTKASFQMWTREFYRFWNGRDLCATHFGIRSWADLRDLNNNAKWSHMHCYSFDTWEKCKLIVSGARIKNARTWVLPWLQTSAGDRTGRQSSPSVAGSSEPVYTEHYNQTMNSTSIYTMCVAAGGERTSFGKCSLKRNAQCF